MTEKRSSVVPLTKPISRGVKVPGIEDQVIITLDPEEGVTVRLKRGRRKLVIDFQHLIDVGWYEDTRKRQPRHMTAKDFLLGK